MTLFHDTARSLSNCGIRCISGLDCVRPDAAYQVNTTPSATIVATVFLLIRCLRKPVRAPNPQPSAFAPRTLRSFGETSQPPIPAFRLRSADVEELRRDKPASNPQSAIPNPHSAI